MEEAELARRLKGIEFKVRHALLKIEELREDMYKERIEEVVE